MNSAKRAVRLLIMAAVLLVCAWYLVSQFEWQPAVALLAGKNWAWLLAVTAALFLVNVAARTLRWWVLIRGGSESMRLSSLYLPTMVFVSLSMLTPGQIGEAAKVEAFRRRTGMERLPGLGVFFVERLFDLMVVLSMALGGLVLFLPSQRSVWVPAIIALALLGLAAFLALRFLRLPGRPGKLLERLRGLQGSALSLLGALGLTALAWGCVVASWQAVLILLGMDASFAQSLALTGLTTLGVIASFIPGGIGVSEVVIAETLQAMGFGRVESQAAALGIRLQGLWWIAIGLAHLGWWAVFPSQRSLDGP